MTNQQHTPEPQPISRTCYRCGETIVEAISLNSLGWWCGGNVCRECLPTPPAVVEQMAAALEAQRDDCRMYDGVEVDGDVVAMGQEIWQRGQDALAAYRKSFID